MLLSSGLSSNAAPAPGWLDADIGSPALAGSATYTNGVWTILGGGSDVCTSDQLHFAWKPISGDATITAQVLSLAGAPSGQAGISFRNDSTKGTLEASVLTTTNSGVTFQWRTTQGAGCSYQVGIGVQNATIPGWVRLTRSGNSFSGFYSTNGQEFIQVGSTQTVP